MTSGLRWLCIALIAVGLAVCGYSAWLRISEDARHRNVMVLVDWRELNLLAEADEQASSASDSTISSRRSRSLAWTLLEELPGAWLSYGEETVGDLLAQGIIRPASIVTTAPAYEVVDQRYVDQIAQGAARHGYWYERSAATGGDFVVQLPQLGSESVSNLPLAWREDVPALARSQQVPFLLRPQGTAYLGTEGLAATLRMAADQPMMLFSGREVLGYPHQIDEVAKQVEAQGQLFGWVEFDDQDGGAALASKLAPNVVRVHSIPAEEMEQYTVEEAVQRLVRAVRERGIRVLYLRPFLSLGLNEPSGSAGFRSELANLNQSYFAALRKGLSDAGFSISAEVEPFGNPPSRVHPFRRLTIALAGIGAVGILLSLLFPSLSYLSLLRVMGFVALIGIAAVRIDSVFTLLLLGIGVAFPLLGFWWALKIYQRLAHDAGAASARRLFAALLALLAAAVTSTVGGLLIHGGMWDARSLLHIDQFRGVTLALAIPALMVAAYAWQAETLQDAWDAASRRLADFWLRFTTLWTSPIRYGDVAFILLAVGALGVVLLRSGNEGPVGALGAESWLRGALEGALEVRPRTKELLGHPALVLFLLSLPWRTRLSLLLALGGILGQVSITNTFMHLHTPLLVTLQRVALGLLLGALTALVWGALALLIAYLWNRWKLRSGQVRIDFDEPQGPSSA